LNNLKPIIKWTGGKRRELKYIKPLLPNNIKQYVEPFIGGGALFFHLNHHNSIINDFDFDLINFYKHVNNPSFIEKINYLKSITNHDEMESLYYKFRDNPPPDDLCDRASQFVYINQLAFSGMRRFNKNGKFNVPFGHYKSFNPKISNDHINLLSNTIIHNDSAMNIIPLYDNKNTFIFLDPPYTRTFKTYSANNDFNEDHQTLLAHTLSNIKYANWMMVINDDPFIINLYKNFNISSYDLKYGVNIKNRFNTNVKHLVISNYSLPSNSFDLFVN